MNTLPNHQHGEPFIVLEDVSRNFGANRAVRNVSMVLARRGAVHALVGENGAGKSTCLGLAAGRLPPSSGHVLVAGERLSGNPLRESRRRGVRAIYQELTVLPALSPQANVFLGQETARGGWLRERQMRQNYESLCEQMGVRPIASTRTSHLSVAEQQMLEILRAVAFDASAILFDEPTAALAHAERESLFRAIADLARKGVAIAIVTHNLEEVLDRSDVVTVMRDGAVVDTRPTAEWSKGELVGAMLDARPGDVEVGFRVPLRQTAHVEAVPSGEQPAPPVLVVKDLAVGRVEGVSFELQRGEILGIAGLVGSGRTSVLRALAGLNRRATGSVCTSDGVTSVPRSVPEARRRGIAMLPESRKIEGLILSRSATDNVMLGEWGRLSRIGFTSDRSLQRAAVGPATKVGFDPRRLGSLARELSGGNQQKLMLARWLVTEHEILLADEPTRGVDVGAKREIREALESIVATGRSVILVSSELEEVVGLSDRLIVLNAGRVVGTLDSRTAPIDPEVVLHMMFDAESAPGVSVEGVSK
jgi:ABC-type sugar transport system ATPase subunit